MSRADPLEVACSLVGGVSAGDRPADLREIAGILALLSLLGIVSAFYQEAGSGAGADGTSTETARAASANAAGAQGDPGALLSGLSTALGVPGKIDLRMMANLLNLLGAIGGFGERRSGCDGTESATQGTGAQTPGPVNPKMLGLILNLLGTMARPAQTAPGGHKDATERGEAVPAQAEPPGKGDEGPLPGDTAERHAGGIRDEDPFRISVDAGGALKLETPESSAGGAAEPPARETKPRFPGRPSWHRPGRGISRSPIISERRPPYLDHESKGPAG